MSQLFRQVASTLERQPSYSSTKDLKVIVRADKFYGISRESALKTPENRSKLLAALKDCGYKGKVMPRFSQIVNRVKETYDETGWKYVEEFLDLQRINGGRFHSVLVELGERPLYSRETRKIAKSAIDKLCSSLHAYWKIERMDSLESLLHVHILILAPDGHRFPRRVNNFVVKCEELGNKPKYAQKTPYENVRDFLRYLLKPADARCNGRFFEEMYFEWWENELRKEAGKRGTWETVALKGAKGLAIDWLESLDRAEIEARYATVPAEAPEALEPFPYNHTYAPYIPPIIPLPVAKNRLWTGPNCLSCVPLLHYMLPKPLNGQIKT